MITMRSLCCGLWSRGGNGDHYEVIVLWPYQVAAKFISVLYMLLMASSSEPLCCEDV